MDAEIVRQETGALDASAYRSYELAKASDGILGGTDIAQIRSYAAYARAQAQAIHKSIAAMTDVAQVAEVKKEAIETEQTYARVGIYSDQRIGEILTELPKRQGARTDVETSSPAGEEVNSPAGEITPKTQAIEDAGMTTKTAYDYERMAKHPEVIERVIADAEREGRVASRAEVLRAIRERDRARQELDDERRNPRTVEVEVAPADYEETKRELEKARRAYERAERDFSKMRGQWLDARSELDKANALLGERDREHDARRDIAYFTTATNAYLRSYGGRVWAFNEFRRVDEPTQKDFIKAIESLAAFAQNLAERVKEETDE